jgi:drug/metabolite transporter (DMT)-like permease
MAILYAMMAALAFGLSAPLAKLLLVALSPLLLAGLLYLGAGLFLGVARLVWRGAGGRPLGPGDRQILAGVVLTGGVLAPPLLLWGLVRSPAASTALLLNLEVVFTALLAGLVFRERLGARVVAAAAVMALGGTALGWTAGGTANVAGVAAVVLACLLWALDNNLMGLIAEADPLLIVTVKGLGAGSVNTILALARGEPVPPASTIAWGMALGAVSYGTSLVLFLLAMRRLGAARTGAYFATAPFFGAAGAVLLLGEPPTVGLLVAAALMGLATWLLVGETTSHPHPHGPAAHAHVHVGDTHHQHEHAGWEGPEPHDHAHH